MAELNDDREGIEPEALDEDAGDPAAAFDALRRTIETQGAQIGAEMTVMRRGLEAAFDQLEKIEPAQDYKPQLAQLVQALGVVAERLHGVEQSPILRQGATHYAALLERSGEALIRTAALDSSSGRRPTSSAPAGIFRRTSPARGSAAGKIGGLSPLSLSACSPARW
jgi:hypothetical protein